MGNVYLKDYEIHYYEVDYKKRLLLTSLIDYLGDIATCHSEELGVGIEYLKEKKLAWVLYSWDISIIRLPSYGEVTTIKTDPCGFKKFYAFRKFEVLDKDNNIIAKANSVWFLIDIERRRPVRITDKMYEAYGIDENSSEILELFKGEKLSESNGEVSFDVRYSDIDTNRHVNNSKYVAWAMETIPMEVVLNYSLKDVKVNYEKETHYGEKVRALIQVKTHGDQITCLHKIEDSEGNELTLLSTVWEKSYITQ
jgi:medium-chain acyl-[acyl-carrier-protein] hydrolase